MTKVGFISLGCCKNLVDTEVMLYNLHAAGFEITPDEEEAEIIVINTCGFIESAKGEAIDNILDAAELKKYGKCRHIIATGCLVERYREEVMKELPEVDALVGIGSLSDIADACRAVMRGEKYTSFRDKETSALGGDRIITTEPHTAYLKVSEGCDNLCTYCAIPLIRGKHRSRTIEDIVKEAKDLERMGVKEVNLIAQDTTRYGLDIYGEYSLARLVRAITEETNIPWIRLLYCYPDKITDELIEEFHTNDRLVKYMDIPVQHISDSVLKRIHPPTQPSGPMYALATRASKPTTGLHVRTGRGSYVLGNHWACELRNGFASKARTSVCLRVTGGCWWPGELSHYTVRVRERHGDEGPLQIYHRACGHTWTGSLVVKAVVWVGPYCWL